MNIPKNTTIVNIGLTYILHSDIIKVRSQIKCF